MKTIDVYTEPMTLKEIQKHFNKSEAAVGMAVKRMLDRNPDHQDWKIKKGRNTLIAPEGIEWLEDYFIGANIAIIDEEKIRMEAEISKLKELLEAEKKHNADLKENFDKALSGMNNQYLLENSKVKELESKNDELKDELSTYKKTIFGLYIKQKTNR